MMIVTTLMAVLLDYCLSMACINGLGKVSGICYGGLRAIYIRRGLGAIYIRGLGRIRVLD